jgi:hypothetical protein
MKRKDLQHIKLESTPLKVENENSLADTFLTAEGIELKPTYSEQDIENIKHLDFGAGFAPNLRGPFIDETWLLVKKDFQSLLIYLHIAATIRIMNEW